MANIIEEVVHAHGIVGRIAKGGVDNDITIILRRVFSGNDRKKMQYFYFLSNDHMIGGLTKEGDEVVLVGTRDPQTNFISNCSIINHTLRMEMEVIENTKEKTKKEVSGLYG